MSKNAASTVSCNFSLTIKKVLLITLYYKYFMNFFTLVDFINKGNLEILSAFYDWVAILISSSLL